MIWPMRQTVCPRPCVARPSSIACWAARFSIGAMPGATNWTPPVSAELPTCGTNELGTVGIVYVPSGEAMPEPAPIRWLCMASSMSSNRRFWAYVDSIPCALPSTLVNAPRPGLMVPAVP